MNENDSIKCIVFDMDGCLIDTESAYVKCWKKAFLAEGIPIDDIIINSWAGKGISSIKIEIYELTKDHEKTLEIKQRREDFFFEALESDKVELKPYAKEILEFIKDRKVKLGLASSTYKNKAIRILNHFKLLDYFDFTVFGDEVKNVKPSPDIYYEVIKRSNENISNIIVFEDSISGVAAAKVAGIKGIIHVPDLNVKSSNVYLDTFARVNDLSEGIEILKKYLG